MAVYKVPQDVEAEDKLLGPFSFKQFIFLVVMVAFIGMAYVLSKIALPLAAIPLPLVIFFAALALPLRKDQPMEVYLAAIISFIMKPKIRLWQPDGLDKLIEVVAPPVDNTRYGKGYSQEEVQKRLSYLANLVDSQGWSVRGVPEPTTSMRDDLYNEAQGIPDYFDKDETVSQQIDNLLTHANNERRQRIIENIKTPMNSVPVPPPIPVAPPQITPIIQQPTTVAYSGYPQNNGSQTPAISSSYTPMSVIQPTAPDEDIRLTINPYPVMSQSVIQPITQTTQSEQTTTQALPEPHIEEPAVTVATSEPPILPPEPSEEPISPAIIDLASNHSDLSIETLGREAKRIKEKELKENEEIVISLR